MFDLFGESITRPSESTTRMTSLLNASHGFIDWWLAYPKTSRKVAKQQCLDKWARLECAAVATHIKMHTEWLKTQPDWTKENGAFICAPLVYLNQQRWVDWQPEPERKKAPDVLAELKAHKGTKPSAETLAAIAKIKQGATA
jgi:hypothetical protein